MKRAPIVKEPWELEVMREAGRLVAQAHEILVASISAGRWDEAVEALERWAVRARARHDLLGQYVGAYTSAVQERLGQGRAAQVMQRGLESCALLQSMWAGVEAMPPAVLAAVLAEHLRRHFSGPRREGAVRIVEEPDRFRLIFEPCGTGGAMR